MDSAEKIWLLEINTNPCIEESSALLRSYIPRMLDDMFKLSIDIKFRRKKGEDEDSVVFPVEGYPDE